MSRLAIDLLAQRRQSSAIYKVDPRVRFLMALGLLTLTLASRRISYIAVLLAFIIIMAVVLKGLMRLMGLLAISSPFAFLILVLNLSVGFPLQEAATVLVRLLAFISAGLLIFLVVSPDEVEYVMRWLRLPSDMVFATVTALRFIPILLAEVQQIVDAQRSRGLELHRGGLIQRARNMSAVLAPVLLNSVIRAGQIAEAMEARAYGAMRKPTIYQPLSMGPLDISVLASFAILFFLALQHILGAA